MRTRPPAVDLHDDFWNEWLRTLRTVTIPKQHEWLEETGRLENFRSAATNSGAFQGRYYNDSDVYKWVEAACYLLESESDTELRAMVDRVVAAIADAQQDDGYLHTYFTLEAPDDRWQSLGILHELYCAGHLFEAAIAHHDATGSSTLLDVATRFADHIYERFVTAGEPGVPGHEEIELALVKLFHETDDRRYLELAKCFIDRRGGPDSRLKYEALHPEELPRVEYNPGVDVRENYQAQVLDRDGTYSGEYHQDHLPVREQDAPVGHAVRAMYLYCAMTDLAGEYEDDDLRAAVERIWERMRSARMYVTGGIGSSYRNEGFSSDFDLPLEAAYAETCAAVGNVLWNDRLTRLTGESKYGELLERTLYNAVLAGIAVSGDRFRYLNPLARTDGPHPLNTLPENFDSDRFAYDHLEWFTCACCPPNVARLLASLHRYIYSQEEDTVAVDLFASSTANLTIEDVPVHIDQETDYPWEGHVTFEIEPDEEVTFDLRIRVPEWAESATISIDGSERSVSLEKGYTSIERSWEGRTTVELAFEMPVTVLEAHPRARSMTDRVALQRGPIVYCVEEHDNPVSPHELRIGEHATWTSEHRPDLFTGVDVLVGDAQRAAEGVWDGDLYQPTDRTTSESFDVVAVPYYCWGQRDDGDMAVWLPR